MGGIADLDVGGARHRRARIDQVHRIQHPGAILALVAARPVIAAMRTGADHITVGQEAAVGHRIGLLGDAQFQKAVLPQRAREMQGQLMVLRRRRAPEIVPGQTEPVAQLLLHRMPFGGIVRDRRALLQRRQFHRRAMLVGGADRQGVVAAAAAIAGENVGRQHGADQVSQMLDPGHIGDGGGDEDALHVLLYKKWKWDRPLIQGDGNGSKNKGGICRPQSGNSLLSQWLRPQSLWAA